MKVKNLLRGALLLAITASAAYANDKSIGIVAGDPTGVSFKLWQNKGFFGKNEHAIDAALGWKLINGAGIQLKADYVVHKYGVIPVEVGKLPVYYGIGGRLVTGGDADFGVRVPVGVNYLFADEPFDAFLEIAPVLVVVPETNIELSIGLGFRYRFK